jgi:membrane-associated protease RseP (regulator of RpoE activity)
MLRRVLPLVLVLLAAACASDQKERLHNRGWVGGTFELVDAGGSWWHSAQPPALRRGRLYGLPPEAGVEQGLLVLDRGDDTPLAAAGLRPGDLVLRLDGEAVDDPLDFRERIEEREPGSSATIEFWRDGELLTSEAAVGTETFHRYGYLGLGLSLSSAIDIWPFDDGIDLLSLVVIKWDDHRAELGGVEGAYLRSALPDAEIDAPRQEGFVFRVIPITIGSGCEVREQTASVAESAD